MTSTRRKGIGGKKSSGLKEAYFLGGMGWDTKGQRNLHTLYIRNSFIKFGESLTVHSVTKIALNLKLDSCILNMGKAEN